LTLVAHIASAHGGAVEIDSSPGAGSTFTIRLPLAHGTVAPDTERGR
jgi:signal transduction histidine kinase